MLPSLATNIALSIFFAKTKLLHEENTCLIFSLCKCKCINISSNHMPTFKQSASFKTFKCNLIFVLGLIITLPYAIFTRYLWGLKKVYCRGASNALWIRSPIIYLWFSTRRYIDGHETGKYFGRCWLKKRRI